MNKAIKLHEGYLSLDHRSSPGLTEEQARKMGYSPSTVGEGKFFETSTMHCAHCGTVVITNPGRTRERASCFSCNAYICDNCGIAAKDPSYIHESYQQKLNRYHTLGVLQSNG
jgi:hypothetical protein